MDSFAAGVYGFLGLGQSARATAAWLRKLGGRRLYGWDDYASPSDFETMTIAHPHDWPWGEMKALVRTPGIAPSHSVVKMAMQHKVPVIGDIFLVKHHSPTKKLFAVTGTNGKSTATSLMAHLSGLAAGGNIGKPLCLLEEAAPCCLEISSYQLELVGDIVFDGGLLLNITPDHLAHHGGFAAYRDAKFRLATGMKPAQWLILNEDDPEIRPLALDMASKTRLFLLSRRHAVADGAFETKTHIRLVQGGQTVLDLPKTSLAFSLQPAHQFYVAAGAMLGALLIGAAPEDIARKITTFKGLPHRQQRIAQDKTGRFFIINDSKATNLDSARVALETFPDSLWLAGGQWLEATSSQWETLYACLPSVKGIFLFGEAARELEGRFRMRNQNVRIFKTMEEAVEGAWRAIQEEPATILFSPGGKSFDAFAHFEARGEAFCASITRRLMEESAFAAVS